MNKFDRDISDYFGGWERYAIKEDDGQLIIYSPNAMPSISLTMTPEDELFIGPDEAVADLYVLHERLTDKDLETHKGKDGKWKPGRMVVEVSPGNYQVWVGYENDLNKDQRAQIIGKAVDSSLSWAKVTEGCKVVYYDDENKEKLPAKSHKMDPIFEKMSRYFGEFEVGVYRTGEEGKEDAVWVAEANSAYLKMMNAQGRHIFIRPTAENEPYFMLHDDVDKEGLDVNHKKDGKFKPGRFVVETSPDNYQVWIKSERPLDNEEKLYWLRAMKSDPGASPKRRWGRCPGFRNRKPKYEKDGGYPLAKLVWIDWARQAEVPQVEIPKPEQRHTKKKIAPRGNIEGDLPTRDAYYKGVDEKGKIKESEQDIAYMMGLLRRGVDDQTIMQRVRTERSDWESHKGERRMQHYLEETLAKAKSFVSSYVITVEDKARNRRRRVTVDDVPKNEAKKVLNERVKAEAVLLGFEKVKDLNINVEELKDKKKLETRQCKDVGLTNVISR